MGKSAIVDDALVAQITDRLELTIHTIGMTIRSGGLNRKAIEALIAPRIGFVAVLAKLNSDLLEAEQDDKPTIGPGC